MVDLTTILAIAGLLVGSGGLATVLVQTVGKKIKSPADENDASRVAKEWYRDMLADAKEEREELRKTIDDLRDEKTQNAAALDRLDALLKKKDERISELEQRRDMNAAKLQAGIALTLHDILGGDSSALDPDLEITRIPRLETT